MDEKSFSIHFNPVSNMKSVKDYEDEIEKLKNEIFGLKTQISHSNANGNVPQVIYENTLKLENLTNLNSNLNIENENLKIALDNLKNENKLLENKHEQEIFIKNEKLALLEDENVRLIKRIEKINENKNSNDQIKQKQYEDKCNEFESMKISFDTKYNEILQKYNEIKNKENDYENFINQLKSELNKIIEEKKQVENNFYQIKNENENIKEKSLLEVNEKLIILDKLKNYNTGMLKFKEILKNKLNLFSEKIQQIDKYHSEIKKNTKKNILTEKNLNFLKKIKIENFNFNFIIEKFKEILIIKNQEKTSLIEKLNSKNSSFANKTFQNKNFTFLQTQITDAMIELNICKSYMEKKARENKELKKENYKLKLDFNKKHKDLQNIKLKYENYSGNPIRHF